MLSQSGAVRRHDECAELRKKISVEAWRAGFSFQVPIVLAWMFKSPSSWSAGKRNRSARRSGLEENKIPCEAAPPPTICLLVV
jgi:hypothetical protein